jgi:hypothetical protein
MTPTSHADCPLCRAGLRGLVLGWLLVLGVCIVAQHRPGWWVRRALGGGR